MKGYIIESEGGEFLCHDLLWGKFCCIANAYVHKPYIIEDMKSDMIKSWDCKPVKAHPAEYDGNTARLLAEPAIDLKIPGVRYDFFERKK